MPIQTENEYGKIATATKAIAYAAKNNADIANMSFGMNLKRNPAEVMTFMTANGTLAEDSPNNIREIFNDKIKAFRLAKKADMLLVIAAGNEGSRNTSLEEWGQISNNDRSLSPYNFLSYFYDHAITVASSDGMNQLSPFTNTGLTTDLAAPGGNTTETPKFGILSSVPFGSKQLTEQAAVEEITSLGYKEDPLTWPSHVADWYNDRVKGYVKTSDDIEYAYFDGTSMAAPVVAGAAALIKAANPDLTASETRQILLKSAFKNSKLKGLAGQNGLQLNLDAAVQLAEQWEGDQSFYTVNEGSNQDDQLNATPNNTWFKAFRGDDSLRGNHGDDLLSGGAGDDLLIPGEGLDIIKGGKGQDIIRYFHNDESPIARPDRIKMEGDDKIDLSALDGNQSKPGVQKLKLIDSDEFSRKPGELLARSNGVFVDLDGDAFADFGILFSKQLNFDLTADNFIL
jgi:subtilisin family serine protease